MFSGGRSTDHGTDLACSPSTRICASFIAKVLEAAPGSAGTAPVDVVSPLQITHTRGRHLGMFSKAMQVESCHALGNGGVYDSSRRSHSVYAGCLGWSWSSYSHYAQIPQSRQECIRGLQDQTHRFSGIQYFNSQNAAKALIYLQQIPLCLSACDGMLASLIVLPENDNRWEVLIDRLERTYAWTIVAVTSITWVIIALNTPWSTPS